MRFKLYVSQFDDPYIQQNFKTIGDLFRGIPFLKGEWKFLEFQVLATGTGQKVTHTLGYTPKDVIVTSTIGGSITFNYNSFDGTYLNFDATVTTSPMTVRAFVGRYSEESVNV